MNPWPIAPLGTKDLDFAIVNYGFTDLAANDLGPLPPLEIAMDLDLADIAASIADQAVLIASMDGIFDDAAGIIDEISGDDFNTVLADLGSAATTGDSLLSDYTTLVTPTTGPPPGGGGGGTCSGTPTTYSARVSIAFNASGSPLILCLSANVRK